MEWLSETSVRWSDDFEQTADIDASATSSWNSNDGFIPIGNNTTKFTGSYDGGNNSISQLSISRSNTDYVGLFGYLEDAQLNKLMLTDVSISGQNNVGGFAGKMVRSGISECGLSGSLFGSDSLAGIIGNMEDNSTLTDSYTLANVTRVSGSSGESVAAVISEMDNSSVNKVYSTGSVYFSGSEDPTNRGFVYYFMGGSNNNNLWNSEVSNQTSAILASSKSTAEMKNVVSYTDTRSDDLSTAWSFTDHPFDDESGEGQGTETWNIDPNGSINNGYPFLSEQFPAFSYSDISISTGELNSITTNSAVGRGYVRNNSGETISSAGLCWSTSSSPTTADSHTTDGAIVTFSSDLSGLDEGTTYYIRAYVTTNIDTYYGNERSFATEYSISEPSLVNGKYQITSLSELAWISDNSSRWGYDYEQTANIDASGTSNWNDGAGFSPIGERYHLFTGSYDGKGYTIDQLFINRPYQEDIGLFGYSNSPATLTNILVTNANISGKLAVGILIGTSWNATISNCMSSGSVSGTETYVGGLIGDNYADLSSCYSTADVSGTGKLGGLCGETASRTISNCYSRGSVTRSSGTGTSIAAFIGYISEPTIRSCFATGAVTYDAAENPTDKGFIGTIDDEVEDGPSFSDNFFDKTTTGQSTDALGGATGKTTSDMKDLENYTYDINNRSDLSTAWDFVSNPYDDSANNDDWDIDDSGSINDGYPYLSWQNGEDQSLFVSLSSFSGKATTKGIELNWSTSAEIENMGFNILRIEGDKSSFTDQKDDILDNHQKYIIASYVNIKALEGQGSVTEITEYSFTDSRFKPGQTYTYILSDIDYSGKVTIHDKKTITVKAPLNNFIVAEEFALGRSYPNPFNASFTIPYILNEELYTKITLFNVNGQQVMTLVDNTLPAGEYHNRVNTNQLASGIYFLQIHLKSPSPINSKLNHQSIQKIILLK